MTQRTSIDSFTYIRIIACFGIILLHSLFASNVYFADTISAGEILWTKVAENLLMWAVPCFLIVTGALLLDPARTIPMSKLLGKYVRRIALALVTFTLIFQILGYLFEGEETILTGWLHDLFLGQSWAHMWYLYLMIGIYLMIPLYKMVANQASDRMLDYALAVLILFTSILPVFEVFGYPLGFYIPTAVIYPAYVFLGYRLFHRPLQTHTAVLLAAGCSIAIIALTYVRYGTDLFAAYEADPGNELDVLYGYSSILVIGQTAGVFCLLNRLRRPAGTLTKTVDQCTFGIYLIHMIGIHMIMKWYGFDPYSYGPIAFLFMAAALFAVSFGITWIIRKIPKLDLL